MSKTSEILGSSVGYNSEGRGHRFESCRVRHSGTKLRTFPAVAVEGVALTSETASASASFGPETTISDLPTTISETKARMQRFLIAAGAS